MEAYLVTNYTKCPKISTFLASKTFVITSDHIITAIVVPLNFFCIFLILFKTPKKMASIRMPMLHVQLASLTFDITMNILLQDVFYMPAPVCSYHGVYSFFGVPHKFQSISAQFSLYLIGMSIVCIYQNRHSSTTTIPRRMTRTSTKVIYYSISYLFGVLIFSLYLLEDFDNDTAKLSYLPLYPCPPLEYFSSDSSAWSNSPALIGLIMLSGCLYIFLNTLYFVVYTVKYLVIVPSSAVSEKTRQLQLRFLIVLSIQLAIPIIALLIPTTAIVIILWFGFQSQVVNNLVVFGFCSHGLMSGIALVLIQKPYRDYTFQFLLKNRVNKSLVTVRTASSSL